MRHHLLLFLVLFPIGLYAQFGEPNVIDYTAVYSTLTTIPGDIDGDGDLDMFMGHGWFSNRGDGTFFPLQEIGPLIMNPFAADLADLDMDGDLDLVGGGSMVGVPVIYWFENDGTGIFGPIQVIDDMFTAGDFRALVVVDLDGDGDQDVLTGNNTQDFVVWLENEGNGSFAPWQLIATVDSPTSISTADLDEDGDLDIVLGGYFGTGQAWYRNDGSGTFSQVIVSALGFGAWAHAAVGDVNGDGSLDVIGTNGISMSSVYLNNGSGQFTLGSDITITDSDLELGDVDSDGDLDLLVDDLNVLRWWFNDGFGVFSPGPEVVTQTAPGGVDLADMNGDGITDLVYVASVSSPATYKLAGVVIGLGGGLYEPERLIVDRLDQIEAVTVADLDGDGLNDVIKAAFNTDKISWFRNEGVNGFSTERVITRLAESTESVLVMDMDDDGDLDMIYGGGPPLVAAWCANDGSGNFSTPIYFSGVTIRNFLSVVDIDGDGDRDLVGYSSLSGSSPVKLYLNDGSGGYSSGNSIGGFQSCRRAVVGDLDNDGDLDIVSDKFNGIVVSLNQGNALFIDSPDLLNWGSNIQLLDVDDDGDLDITFPGSTTALNWLRNQGDGSFDPNPQVIPTILLNYSIIGDVDGDGLEDILYSAIATQEYNWCRNLGSGQFGSPILIPTTASISSTFAFGDVNTDGVPDILFADRYSAELTWHANNITSGDRIEGTVFHDLDGDGVRTPNEPGIQGPVVNVTPGLPSLLSLGEGQYAAYVDQGSYQVSVNVNPTLWSITTTDPLNVAVTTTVPVVTGADMGIRAIQDTTILIPSITLASAVCGANTSLWLSVANDGTLAENCEFVLTLDTLFDFVSSYPAPTVVIGNTYRWTLDTLPLYGTLTIPLLVTMPQVLQIGNNYTISLDVISHDANNVAQHTFSTAITDQVSCSYDPNDKLVDPRGYGIYGALELDRDTLDYTIRFQNTGNAPAQTVLLRDPLDPILDPTRIQLLGYSHPISQFQVNDQGNLVVRFDSIQLPGMVIDPVGSQGFVRFRVRPHLDAVEHLSTAHNNARIFFDLNAPVITNTTLTTWVDCDLWQPQCTVYNLDSLVAEEGDVYHWFLNGELLADAHDRTLLITGNGDYAVQVTSIHGCIASSPTVTVTSVGMDNRDAQRMVLVPNPFTAQTRLFLSEVLTTSDRIDLVDVSGSTVRTLQGMGAATVTIDRGALASGIYMLRIVRKGKPIVATRMVVE